MLQCYADGTIEDMREEKVIMDFPDIADKLIEMNTQVRKYKLKMILTVFVVTTEAQRPESSLCSENEEV